MTTRFAPFFLVLIPAAAARATPIRVPVNVNQSSINVELCVEGVCDDDTSAVAGEVWIKLDPFAQPASITLYDFTFELTSTIDLFLDFGFAGDLTATGEDIVLLDADPSAPLPPADVVNGQFNYPDVPTNSTGTVTYDADGLVCSIIEGYGLPCEDTIDMADQGTQSGAMVGSVAVSDARVVTLNLDPDLSIPLDPENPEFGTFTVTGDVVGTVTVPVRGDVDLSGTIDGDDVQEFVNVLLDPDSVGWKKRFAADMNDDDVFDASDAVLFADCLLSGACPE